MNKHYNTLFGFSERLKSEMENKKMTRKTLAERICMERKSVYSWVDGYSMPNALILAKICKVLNVSADYLLFGK